MNIVGIIPARYHSLRLEGKPLVDIAGKTMIQRVYEQASLAIDTIFIATDDDRIAKEVERFGGKVIMTSAEHNSGTNRCLEAASKIRNEKNIPCDWIVNVQGDEPLLDPQQIRDLTKLASEPNLEVATLIAPVHSQEELDNESECFVVMDKNNNALYFSRSVIPYQKGIEKSEWLKHHSYYKHVGLYMYSFSALEEFAKMPQSPLEKAESLEQNRWLENGRKIKVNITHTESIPVDTPEDLEKVRNIFRQDIAKK